MNIPTFIIREMIPLAPDAPSETLRDAPKLNLKRRADPVYKERAIANTKKFLEANPDYKRDWDSVYYHRPFVIFDSEGCRIKDAPPIVMYSETETEYAKRVKVAAGAGEPKPKRKGVEYPAHASFLWMAGYWQRTRPGTGIGPGDSSLHHSGTEGADGNYISLERPDKSALPTKEILHWLTEAPKNFPHAIFASFAFGYDVAQLLAGIPYKVRKKICRNRYEDDDGEVHELSPDAYKHFWLPKKERPAECDGYGIAYLKGKFSIRR